MHQRTLAEPRTTKDAIWVARICLVGVYLFFPMKLGVANTLLALVLILTIISGNFRELWIFVCSNPITMPAITMFALIVIGATYSTAPAESIVQALNKYSKFLFLILATALLGENKWRHRCWMAFLAAMLLTICSVYAGLWVHIPWAKGTTPAEFGADHTVFKDYIAQGLLLSTFAALAITRAIEGSTVILTSVWAAFALSAVVAVLFMSIGRTGYLAMFSMIAVYAWAIAPNRLRLSSLLITSCLIALSIWSSPTLKSRVSEVFTDAQAHLFAPAGINWSDAETSTGARLIMWKFSIEQIKKKPLLGAGTGSYGSLAQGACRESKFCDTVTVHPHNQFLFFGVELGLIGLFTFCWYLYAIAKASVWLPSPRRALLLSFLAIFVVDSLLHGALWLAVENHLFTFILALLMAEVSAVKQATRASHCR